MRVGGGGSKPPNDNLATQRRLLAMDMCEGMTASKMQLHVENPMVSLGAYIIEMIMNPFG